MKFYVLAYNFPHWKTQQGLFNLVMNGFIPECVVLQDKKTLNVPQSEYRITPKDEYLLEPDVICYRLGLDYYHIPHDKFTNCGGADFAVILGARILPQRTIDQFQKGILNIHPGILPGNRGLDNLKWSLIKRSPIGVTAHFIDSRIDMGHIVKKEMITVYEDDTIRDLYLRQRDLQMSVLIKCMKQFVKHGINYADYEICEHSEKFGVINQEDDQNLEDIFYVYKYGISSLINN